MLKRALLMAMLAAGPAAASPEYILPTLFDVQDVAANDVLNIREAPDAKSAIIGTLAPDATGIEVVGTDRSGQWGQVNAGERAGWVAMRFLTNRTDVWQPGALPAGFTCGGTEPFWSVQTVENGLVLTQPGMDERKLTLRKVMDRGVEGEPTRGMIAGDDKGRLTAVMQPQQCSDGMSDRAYALAVTVIMDGQDSPSRMLTGCCSIAP